MEWVAPKDKKLQDINSGEVVKAGALGACGVCGQLIEGGKVIGPIEGKRYHKECWLREVADKCEGCGKVIDTTAGSCVTITAKSKDGETEETKTTWHPKCWEKEKKRRARQPKGGFAMVAGGPPGGGKKGKKLSRQAASAPAMPFAHMFDGMGDAVPAAAKPKPKRKGGKKGKGKGAKQAAADDGEEDGASEELLRAFDSYAARQLDFNKALENVEDLMGELAALEAEPEPQADS